MLPGSTAHQDPGRQVQVQASGSRAAAPKQAGQAQVPAHLSSGKSLSGAVGRLRIISDSMRSRLGWRRPPVEPGRGGGGALSRGEMEDRPGPGAELLSSGERRGGVSTCGVSSSC
jgi:hypothetical protein